jgi:hypothetical protein
MIMDVVLRVAVDRFAAVHLRRRVKFALWLMWWPFVVLTLAAIALQLGVWRKEINIAGPFAPETNPAQHSLVVTVPSEGSVPWWRQPLNGDSVEKPLESKLRLRIDGREIWPAHVDPALIREGNTTGYSHWGSQLIFSLPSEVKNGPETVVTLWYKVRPRLWVSVALLVLTLAVGLLLCRGALRSTAVRFQDRVARALSYIKPWALLVYSVPYILVFGVCLLGLGASALFLGCGLYALTAGWALPTTAGIRWFPGLAWAARHELYFGWLLLSLAGLGTLTGWLSAWTRQEEPFSAFEPKLIAFLRWSGLPIAATAFLLSLSAMWEGMLRPGDPHWANIGGLIPLNDAHGHLVEAFFEATNGVWSPWALRRPLAAAFRAVLLFMSGYSFPLMLALQACALAFVLCLASYAVMVWRGIWAGLAFFALAYIYARVFMPTSLTEPLGLFWSLLSLPFFVASFRSGSVKPALVAFAISSTALMTRMGSMFTIPALLLWLIWQFGRTISDKFKIGACAIGILLTVTGVNSLLSKGYGNGDDAQTGSNFSYVVCGLSIGTTWDGCLAKLAEQGEPLKFPRSMNLLVGDEAAVARRLYAFAWQNFKQDPTVFFKRLMGGAKEFMATFPGVIWKGYAMPIDEPAWLFPHALELICLIGLFQMARTGMGRLEIAFWLLFWVSIIASSAIIYYDDGARTLAASHPLMALFVAIGFSNPGNRDRKFAPTGQLLLFGVSGLAAAAILFVSVPWIAFHLSSIQSRQGEHLQPEQDEAFVFGGQHMSGSLVVSDASPLRSDTPTLHLKDFEAIVKQSGVEHYQGLVHPVSPATPFGFVFAPHLELGVMQPDIFIVPADVVERRDVRAWHFRFQPWAHKKDGLGQYWFFVTKAKPWRE